MDKVQDQTGRPWASPAHRLIDGMRTLKVRRGSPFVGTQLAPAGDARPQSAGLLHAHRAGLLVLLATFHRGVAEPPRSAQRTSSG